LEGLITRNLGPQLDEFLMNYFYQDEDLITVVRVIAA